MSAAAALSGAFQAPAHHDASAPQHWDARPTLLVTTVDIGEGRAGRIEVRLGDNPVHVARAFCARHGLPEAILLPLAQHLEDNLAENAAAAASGTPASRDYASDEDDSDDCEGYGNSRQFTPLQAGRPGWAQQEAPSRGADDPHCGQAQAGGPPAGQRPAPHHLHVEPSSHSAGMPGGHPPTAEQQRANPRPQTAGAAPAAAEADQQGRLSFRPASVRSARGAEYFNQAPTSSGGSGETDSDGGLQYRAAGSGGQLPAHSRLYADHFRKQQRLEEERRLRDLEIQLKTEQVHIAPASNKLAAHRSTGSYGNYGERLYVEGRLEALKKEQLAQRIREQEALAELEQFTFQPEISRMAQNLKQGEAARGGSGGGGSAYQRLYQRGGTAKRQERMQAIRQEQADAEVRECSFQPQINPKSARMVQQRQHILKESGIAGFEQLHADDLRRRLKLQQLAARPPEEATFQPKVNKSSVVLRKLLEGRGEEQPNECSDNVADRLLERGRRYQAKLQAAQQLQVAEPRDSATGQPLFRPKTHRPPQYERNPEGAPIGEYLYSIQAEWNEKATRTARASRRRSHADAASTFVNSRSARLVVRLKRERFRAIFDYLRRGQPAPVLNLLETLQDEVFMDTIDPEVRADIEYAGRLLARAIARRHKAELQDSASSASDSSRASAAAAAQSTNGELEADSFVALMEEVVARTKGLTRQYLLPLPSTRQKFEEPSFRPAIDPHSQMLAARLRPDSLPTFEILYKTAEEQAARLEGRQRAAEAAKLQACSFRPAMVAAQPKAQEGRAIKLAAELRSKHASEAEEVAGGGREYAAAGKRPAAQLPAAPVLPAKGSEGRGGGGGGGQAELHFDALERQINDALMRLSLSEEQVAASLRQAAEDPAPAPALVGQAEQGEGYRLDCSAILGTPHPEDLIPPPGACPLSPGLFSPLDSEQVMMGSPARPQQDDGVAWADTSTELVAQVMGGDKAASGLEDLAGLDLQALASAGLPQHATKDAVVAEPLAADALAA